MPAATLDDFVDLFGDEDVDEDPDYVPVENNDIDSDDSEDSDSENARGEPISRSRTRQFREGITNDELFGKVRRLLDIMGVMGLDLAIVLDVITWLDEDSIADAKFRYARTALMTSIELPGILRRCANPPGDNSGEGQIRRKVFDDFALEHIGKKVKKDIQRISKAMSPPKDPLSQEGLESTDFKKLADYVFSDEGAPTLTRILMQAGWSKNQAERNTHKTPKNVILMIISILSYTRSHHRNRIPQLFAIYLRANGLSARAFDALHAMGIVMSHKWTANAIMDMSDRAMEEMCLAFATRFSLLNYDNGNIRRRVFSMRIDHEGNFHCVVVGCLWALPAHIKIDAATLNREFQRSLQENWNNCFDFREILETPDDVRLRTEEHNIHLILSFILHAPELGDYEHRNDPILARPPPVDQLPYGPEHIPDQFIFRVEDVDQASYEGNEEVLHRYQKQLRIDSLEERKKTSTSRFIPIIGDQLTRSRLQGLWKFKFADMNGYERQDWTLPIFGWFHLIMALANNLYKQYYGTSSGIGFKRAFDLLNRKGLDNVQTKGPFWHHLNEGLYHVAAASFLACTLEVAQVHDLAELKQLSPEALRQVAKDVHERYATHRALKRMDACAQDKKPDEFKRQSVMFNIDVLVYISLRDAIKRGDVGRMEDSLPHLLQRFAGGGNTQYMGEVLDLIQGLRVEWPEEVRSLVKRHCWVVNRTGKEDGSTAIDQAMEQVVGDVKYWHHSMGPNAGIDYMSKTSPATRNLKIVKKHFLGQISMLRKRGTKHTTPDSDKDIARYMTVMRSEKWFKEKGRKMKVDANRAKDFATVGVVTLFQDGAIDRWWKEHSFKRETKEEWEDEMPVENEGGLIEPAGANAQNEDEEQGVLGEEEDAREEFDGENSIDSANDLRERQDALANPGGLGGNDDGHGMGQDEEFYEGDEMWGMEDFDEGEGMVVEVDPVTEDEMDKEHEEMEPESSSEELEETGSDDTINSDEVESDAEEVVSSKADESEGDEEVVG